MEINIKRKRWKSIYNIRNKTLHAHCDLAVAPNFSKLPWWQSLRTDLII